MKAPVPKGEWSTLRVEPFTALDEALAQSLLKETAQLASSFKTTLVLVSHRGDDARALGCRVIAVEKPAGDDDQEL